MRFELTRQRIFKGLASGDRIGGPAKMASLLGRSLIEKSGFDAADTLDRYLAWYRVEGFDTGPVAARVFDLVLEGVPHAHAVRQVHLETGGRTAGCNPVHRIAPLAVCTDISDSQLACTAMAEAALTHFDALAGDVSAAAAILIRSLVKGETWPRAIEEAAIGRMQETQLALVHPGKAPRQPTGYAPDVLAAAVHFLDREPDFMNALDASMQFAGPSNYCPVLVGAIGAVRYPDDLLMGQDDKPCEMGS